MTQFTLTLLDTTGIQEYIFTSNRLQENIGASELVYRATSLWAFDALDKVVDGKHNLLKHQHLEWEFSEAAIEADEKLQAEVIQAAGGNTILLFREKNKAREFAQKLTLRLLKEAPGLTVLAKHLDDFDFKTGSLAEARKQLEADMRQHKQQRIGSAATLGLGVTAMCDSTGLAAVRTPVGRQSIGEDAFTLLVPGQDEQEPERNRLISREITFKLAARDLANARLKHVAGEVAQWYEFPFDVDNLGRIMGEESYVAVVHADGNQMGRHVSEIAKAAKGNREYVNAMRSFSQKLEKASRATLVSIVEKVVASIKEEKVAGEIPLVKDKYHTYIPIRPLVFGGDDITFLCNGQLGVELATLYLKIFKEKTQEVSQEADTHPLAKAELETLFASAGVSIVKMHYPFARAYKLSEELAGSAKSLTRDVDCSALDWHFAQGGLSGSLESIREREYMVVSGRLHLRPLKLVDWHKVEGIMNTFNDRYWGEKHNKVIGLREHLRNGPQAVGKYRLDFDLRELPQFDGSDVHKTGWKDGVCYYFDAIELLDHHVSLKNKESA